MKYNSIFQKLKETARKLKREVIVLYFSYRDPRTPLYVRVFVGCIVAYALSPIDLIPDFIPVLGYLDDLVIVPLGIWLALKMIPSNVLIDARNRADECNKNCQPNNYITATIFIFLWITAGILISVWVYKTFF